MSKVETNTDNSIPFGLIVHGIILKRTRRYIETKNGEQAEIVSYVIGGGEDKRKIIVDDYSPTEYYNVNTLVSIPVYVKPFPKKAGGLSYTLNVQKEFNYVTVGEEF